MKKSVPYKPILLEKLRDLEFKIAYLNAAIEDGDPRVLFIAINNVREAEGKSVADLAKESGLDRANLYRILGGESDPVWTTVKKILNALGFENCLRYTESHSKELISRC